MTERGMYFRVAVGAIVLVLAVVVIWGIRVQTAEIRGRGDAEITIQSGGNRIVQYEYFFALCESVQSAEASIDAQRGLLGSPNVSQAMVEQNLAALEATRARSINTYNARAAQDYTSGQFRDSDLPYQLPSELYTGEKTQCAS